MKHQVFSGRPAPLGATAGPDGTNFAVSSGVTRCLFDADGTETQLVLPDRDGDVWHGFVPEVRAGQAYGFRVSGPFDPARGVRYKSAKLLLDPYARAIDGEVLFGPELLGHAVDNPSAPSQLDSAAYVPRSLVISDVPESAVQRPGYALSKTILYEVHARNPLQHLRSGLSPLCVDLHPQHPGVPRLIAASGITSQDFVP